MELQFRICSVCGNMVAVIHDSGVPIICCGQEMDTVDANSTDASVEKHVPQIEQDGNTVHIRVGSIVHPMTEQHSIQWIAIQTRNGNQRKVLSPADAPEAQFALCNGDEIISACAYCNQHGLWVNERE